MTRIVLYTTPYCGYCRAAKALLERKGLGYVEIDVSGDFAKREEMMARAAGRCDRAADFHRGPACRRL